MSDMAIPNRDENARARVTLALSLRAKKLPYEQIAHQCGYKDESGARKAVKREFDRITCKNVQDLRTEELFMLDKLHSLVWEQIVIPPIEEEEDEDEGIVKKKKTNQKPGVNLWAVDRILAISERRCKLMGLDVKPEDIEGKPIIIREVPVGWIQQPVQSVEEAKG